MLTVGGTCRVPRTPLQPDAPAREVSVPIDGMPDFGLIRSSAGHDLPAVFVVHENSWFLGQSTQLRARAWRVDGKWATGTPAQWQAMKDRLPPPTQFKTVALPTLPVFPTQLQPIPRTIHYLWLGNAIPSQTLIDNIASNCGRSSSYVSTLHVDIPDPAVLSRVRETFSAAAPSLVIAELRGSAFFSEFSQSERYAQYLNVTTGPGRNYSAASDVLRYPLIHHHGGSYMDVDDALQIDINDVEILAAPNDVLLGPKVSEETADFSGYNSSIFASHARNPVLAEISTEMQARYLASDGFFDKVRPYVNAHGVFTNQGDAAMDVQTYAKGLFRLTGPAILNDVVAVERPDYYRLCFSVEPHTNMAVTHKVWDKTQADQHLALIDHYFPFINRAPVEVGAEHSWLNT